MIDENSTLWHRRLGHANMRLIQSLASKELVRNLPKLKFDQHFCDAFKIGKQAHASHKAKNIVSTTRCLEPLHMDLFGPSTVQSYGENLYTLVIVDDYSSKAYIILNKHTIKIKESLNVTFDETPPPSNTSSLVDDDLDEEEATKAIEKKNLENDIEDETLEFDKVVNIKESMNHPLENVIENLNQRTIRFLALGWHLEEILMTWDHLEKKRTKLRLYTKNHEELFIQNLSVTTIKRRRYDIHGDGIRDSAMALGRGRLKVDPEPSTWQRHQEDRGFNVGNTKVASIKDPMVKLAHRCIATTIARRKETTHRVAEIDLYYLYYVYTPEEEAKEEAEGDAGHRGVGGSANIYHNMIQGDWKFLIKNGEEIFTDAEDGVRIFPDGVASPAM
nr:retrovirus-related Pol polyprotein from transposon TNT 1-94 [Tanacetum cinerariifolium]